MRAHKVYKGPFGVALKVMPDRSLRFVYSTDCGMTFTFSLFCEVGQPWQPAFRALLKMHGLTLGETIELASRPWLSDTLEKL